MFRGVRGFVCTLLLVALQSSLLFGTAAISGNLQDAGGSAISGRVFVRFWLRGCNDNQPRVAGVALIAPTGGPGYYKDFTPDAAGAISGTLYKNSEVECNGATGNTWWGVQVYRDGKPGPETPYGVVAASFSLNTASPLVQSPPPPPATFPYIMANPLAAQTISNFPLAFGAGSGLSANYQGSVRAAGSYLRSDGSSFFAPVASNQLASDIVFAPSLNGLAYWNGSALSTTPTGGAGTLCLVSNSGGAPLFSSCAGSASTAWSALSAPSANLIMNMGLRTTRFNWGTGTSFNELFFIDGSAGDGFNYTLLVRGQPSAGIARFAVSGGTTTVLDVNPDGTVITGTAAFKAGPSNNTMFFTFQNPPSNRQIQVLDPGVGLATMPYLERTQTWTAAQTFTVATFNSGVSQGSGYKHQRFGATTPTAGVAGATQDTTYTWTSAFADANYTANCTGEGANGVPTLVSIQTHSASQISVRVAAITAAAASYAAMDCKATHD